MNMNNNLEFHLWSDVLVYLYDHQDDNITIRTMCNSIGGSVSSVSQNIIFLQRKELIRFELKGRTNTYKLTHKGLSLGELLSKAKILIK